MIINHDCKDINAVMSVVGCLCVNCIFKSLCNHLTAASVKSVGNIVQNHQAKM